jgi:hypothetical protein
LNNFEFGQLPGNTVLSHSKKRSPPGANVIKLFTSVSYKFL